MSGTGFAPFFVRLKRSGDRWHAFSGQPSDTPLDTVQLVVEAPEFLGVAFDGGPLPRAAMVAPGSESNRVLVAVNEAGGVVLVACPEPDGAQALVGELVAAGAKLWHRKFEALAGPFEEFLGMSLADWIAARVRSGWSADAFRAGLGASLERGKFPLVIVAPELDASVGEASAYLQGMNLEVRQLSFEHVADAGDELIRPVAVATAAPAQPAPVEAPAARPEPTAAAGPALVQRIGVNEYVPTTTIGAGRPVQPLGGQVRTYEPWPASNATPEQQAVLERLLPLADLGLRRQGFEFFNPQAKGDAVGGTIVVAIDSERWPFPKSPAVVVVVNTGPEHLAGHLRIKPSDVEEFLASLPRVEAKEQKGSLLLRAANTQEATQLVNELKALREISGA